MVRPTLFRTAVAAVAILTGITTLMYSDILKMTSMLLSNGPDADCMLNASARRMFLTLPASTARLGNQMFGHAALIGIAKYAGYRPVLVEQSTSSRLLLDTFTLANTRTVRHPISATRWYSNKHAVFTAPENMSNDTDKCTNTDVELVGYFQSWRYFDNVTDFILADFRFKPNVIKSADSVLERLLSGLYNASNDSSRWTLFPPRLIRVGIHVRRGDMAYASSLKSGYVVVDEKYIRHAMHYVEQRLARQLNSTKRGLVYVVCSDESSWVKANIKSSRFPVVHSNDNGAVDMAILASCDHVITTTGTYSWWAGYLAAARHTNAIVTYYNIFLPPDSWIGSAFRPKDVYPPSWIGLA